MNLQLFGNGGTREQELRNAMLAALTETTNQLASTLYTHTWKTRTTPDGNQIISLRASQAKRAAGFSPWEKTPQASDGDGGVMEVREGSAGKYKLRDFAALASWPTPRTSDTVNTNETPEQWAEREREMKAKNPNLGGLHKPLGIVSKLAAWPTPRAEDSESTGAHRGVPDTMTSAVELTSWATPSSRDWKDSAGMATTGTNPDGTERERLDQLPRQANLASWPTPQSTDIKMSNRGQEATENEWNREHRGNNLALYAQHLSAWPTPQAFDASNDGEGRALRYKGNAPSEAGNTRNPETPGSYRGDLKDYAAMAAWPTPNAMEGGQTSRSGERRDEMLMGGMVQPSPDGPARLTAFGVMLIGSFAGMDGGGQLNPALPRWLQAIPAEWGQAALEAHQKLKANKGRASTRTKQRRSQKA